jgi:indolepyruvate ferredoxin oxidoreductase beta subunit
MRWMPYLRQQSGTFIADTQHIVPPFACRNRTRGARTGYVGETIQTVMEQVDNSFALDAMGIAKQLGVVKAANTVLLGALSTALDFPAEAWKSVISKFVPSPTVKVNLLAFDAGREWALGFDRESELRNIKDTRSLHQESTVEAGADYSRVEITEEWCKGCDICVKFCPERCLVMNEKLIVEMAEPELCTGCRMCEWLCPDFAITVHTPHHVPL